MHRETAVITILVLVLLLILCIGSFFSFCFTAPQELQRSRRPTTVARSNLSHSHNLLRTATSSAHFNNLYSCFEKHYFRSQPWLHMAAFLAYCLLAAHGEMYGKVHQMTVLAPPARKNGGMHFASGPAEANGIMVTGVLGHKTGLIE